MPENLDGDGTSGFPIPAPLWVDGGAPTRYAFTMPMEYAIDPERRLVQTLAWGTLTIEEILGARQRLLADPAFDPTFHELMDLTATDAVTFSAEDIRRLASGSVLAPGVRRAFVVASTANYGLARMFEAYAQANSQFVSVFRDLSAAHAWLAQERGGQS
jgi:hypothetical protein